MKYILIIGANSNIAEAVAEKFAKEGFNLYLASRNMKKLQELKDKIVSKYNIDIILKEFDILSFESHEKFYNSLEIPPIGVICASGYLGNNEKAEKDFEEARRIIDTNLTGCVSILGITANDLEKRKEGFIVAISSVAGDRGRKSNYIYGCAKAGLTTYLSGLRSRLVKFNVKVITIKPGFVATKMTTKMKLPKLLTTTPEKAADMIYKAIIKNKEIIYISPIWKYIMKAIRIIPEKIFKKFEL